MELQSMSWFSGFFRAGYLLNRLATKAKFSLGLPRTTSVGMTNCLHPRRSAWSSMHSARFRSSFSCRETDEDDVREVFYVTLLWSNWFYLKCFILQSFEKCWKMCGYNDPNITKWFKNSSYFTEWLCTKHRMSSLQLIHCYFKLTSCLPEQEILHSSGDAFILNVRVGSSCVNAGLWSKHEMTWYRRSWNYSDH